jgi:fluoroacetyl-CoA thioesterase
MQIQLFLRECFMSRPSLAAGLCYSAALTVTDDLTVPQVSSRLAAFADMPPVFATAFMVAFVEATCIACLHGHLDGNEHTVGTHVDLSHLAATPVGREVTAAVRLIAVDGRRLRFEAECRDETGVVGRGFHQRTIIDQAKFMERLAR